MWKSESVLPQHIYVVYESRNLWNPANKETTWDLQNDRYEPADIPSSQR